jgi:hypothetical protein
VFSEGFYGYLLADGTKNAADFIDVEHCSTPESNSVLTVARGSHGQTCEKVLAPSLIVTAVRTLAFIVVIEIHSSPNFLRDTPKRSPQSRLILAKLTQE